MRSRAKAVAPHVVGSGPGEAQSSAPTMHIDEAGSTPILREYRAVKAQHPNAIVLARLGDFYELFGTDAEIAAPTLGVTLTGRGFGSAGRLPMCGVPAHAAAQYIPKLLAAGHSVALWDQVGEVTAGKLVRREVTRVISPGMIIEGEFLDPAATARCVALLPLPGRVGVAALDASTGELQLAEFPGGLDSRALLDELERLDVAELLLPEGAEPPPTLATRAARTALHVSMFDSSRARQRLLDVTGLATLQAAGIDHLDAGRRAAGALLAYCERARITLAPGFVQLRMRPGGTAMALDPQTRRNLELLQPQGGHAIGRSGGHAGGYGHAGGDARGSGGTSGGGIALAGLLDDTRTPMGTRLLRARLQAPLTAVQPIIDRLDAVEALVGNRSGRFALREALGRIHDLDRLVGRCVQGIASPRDLVAVGTACAALPDCGAAAAAVAEAATGAVAKAATDAGAEAATHAVGELTDAAAACVAPDGLAGSILDLLIETPPTSLRDGGAVRPGADAELDQLVAAGSDARVFIAGLEEAERNRTGIRSLRVGYNRVFGYYVEIPHSHRDQVPGDYVRKQTLAGVERYITPELKEHEATVLHAKERSVAREQELVRACAARVADHAAALLRASGCVAVLDVAQALATVADERTWVRPIVDDSARLDIAGGRHPLVETVLGPGRFVPNDCHLDDDARLVVLTGPNMAGKSTYLRQVALIVLLAQVGSYVPAERAHLGICDRIFTRVGAHDDLTAGLSTFMVEMAETAAILQQATPASLVILDEIGRGTSTYDGLSIAQAVIEHLHDAPQLGCRTLFATHYHELTALSDRLPRVRNARVEVVEEGDQVTFLHRIVDGGADRSYGIHVARLAGVPAGVLIRARQLLAEHERAVPLTPRGHVSDGPAHQLTDRPTDQLSLELFTRVAHPVVQQIADLDVEALTPLAALNKLAELRVQVATSHPDGA